MGAPRAACWLQEEWMIGQIQWLWAATFGQFYTGTTLLGWRTTIFVRRFILWFALGVYVAWTYVRQEYGVVSAVPMTAVLAPFYTLLGVFVVTLGMAIFRGCTIPFTAFGGVMGLPGLMIIKLADLFWRIEAGPGPAAAQAARTNADIQSQQQSRQEQRLHDAMMYDAGGSNAALAGRSSVNVDTPQGPVSLSNPHLKDGRLVGTVDGKEVTAGRVVPTGDGYRVQDDSGQVVMAFDNRGLGENGQVIVHPSGEDAQAWKDFHDARPSRGGSVKGGPLVQTAVVALLIASSYFGYQALDGLAGLVEDWLAEEPDTIAEVDADGDGPAAPGQGIGIGKAMIGFDETPEALVERLQGEGYECHVNHYGGGERKGQVSSAGCDLLPDDQDANVRFMVADDGSLEEITVSSFSDSSIHQTRQRLAQTLGEPVSSKEIDEYGSSVRVEVFETPPHRATVHTRLDGQGPEVSITVAIERGDSGEGAPVVAGPKPAPGPGEVDPATGHIIGPAWVICVTASKAKSDTLAKAEDLRSKGFESDVLWIPDYGSMSGAESRPPDMGPLSGVTNSALDGVAQA